MSRKPLLPGSQFGFLTIIKSVIPEKGKTMVVTRCRCEKVMTYTATKVRQGKIKSCGCMAGRYIRKKSIHYYDYAFEHAGEVV